MSEIIKNRSEIVFLYDIKDANPNGDPMDENKPRIDEETGVNIVTDVRLKRTIRDYFLALIEQEDDRLKGQDVFIKELRDEKGYLYDGKRRAKDFQTKTGTFAEMKKALTEEVCKKCLDIRMFGGMMPFEFEIGTKKEKGAVHLIGPIQFRMGRSLHRVNIKFIKGTGAFASDYPGTTQFTFREEYILPYSLISFYGIVNENAAETTSLKETDVDLLMEGIWTGTKNLITRSKIGQIPRILLRVIYSKNNFHIGDLDTKFEPIFKKNDTELRDISEIELNVGELVETLVNNKDSIKKIQIRIDDDVKFILPEEKKGGSKELQDILKKHFEVEELTL
ncbi:MAG: type I-B CRISPR-associated protein Cas7/Csh2 [Candidatus Hodarchaeota archaeon]